MRYYRPPPSAEEQHERNNQWADHWEKKRLDDQRVNWRETTPAGKLVPASVIHPAITSLIRKSDPNFTTLEDWKHRTMLKNWDNWKSLGLVTGEPPKLQQQAKTFRDTWTDDKDEQLII